MLIYQISEMVGGGGSLMPILCVLLYKTRDLSYGNLRITLLKLNLNGCPFETMTCSIYSYICFIVVGLL